jgi:hypothetical protein
MDSSMVEKAVMACFRVPESQYKSVRVYAVREGLTMQEVLTKMLQVWMRSENLKPEEMKQ